MRDESGRVRPTSRLAFRSLSASDKSRLLVELVLLAICVCGVIVSVRMNGVGRSLWIDEAMLASSFSKRSLLGILFGGEFENLQSAPLGWILLVKATTMLFGNTECVLRAWSIVFYALSIALFTLLSKREFGFRHTLLGGAILANTTLVLKYSNMFKPYICDCLVAILICYLFALWLKGRIRTWALCSLFAVLLWFSQPASFVEGGFLLVALVDSLRRKDRERLRETLVLGIVVCASFAIYYLFWVRRMTSVSDMREWWTGQYLSALFESPNKAKVAYKMLFQRLFNFDNLSGFILIAFVYGSARAFRTGQLTAMGAIVALLLACLASLMNFYPVIDRLWLFSFPLILIVALFGVSDLLKRIDGKALRAADVSALCIALACTGIPHYAEPDNVYCSNQEMNPELVSLSEKMSPGDTVYVLLRARPAFEYANGYDNRSFGAGGKDNVIFGDANFPSDKGDELTYHPKRTPSEDLGVLLGLDEVWIVSAALPDESTRPLVDPLLSEGHLELASYKYKTPLYHWCRDASECLAKPLLEIDEKGSTPDTVVVTVKNEGKTYVGTQFEQLYLEDGNTGKRYRVGDMIAPGKSSRVTIPRPSDGSHTYSLVTNTGSVGDHVQVTIG